jgi:uroporphyrinogen-III synthase
MTTTPRIILTRQEDRNRDWSARLVAAGRTVFELPLLRYEPLALPEGTETGTYDWILFTSPQGVTAFVAAGLNIGSAQCGVLGAGTAAALSAAGLRDDLQARVRTGAELAQAFLAKATAPGRVLLPGPLRRLGEPTESLTAAGFEVKELALYVTLPVETGDLPSLEFASGDIVFFCSPSAVKSFVKSLSERPRCVAIGQTTGQVARAAGFPTAVAATPDLEAMVLAAGLDPLPAPVSPEIES